MHVYERETNNGTLIMQEEVAKVDDFRYMGFTVQSNGERGREVKKRRQDAMDGEECQERSATVPARVKGKV